MSYESSKFAKFHAEQRGVFFRSFCESFTSEEDDDETHVCFMYLLKVYPLVVFVSASVVLMHLTPSYEGIIRMILVCYLLKLNTSQGRILHPIFFQRRFNVVRVLIRQLTAAFDTKNMSCYPDERNRNFKSCDLI